MPNRPSQTKRVLEASYDEQRGVRYSVKWPNKDKISKASLADLLLRHREMVLSFELAQLDQNELREIFDTACGDDAFLNAGIHRILCDRMETNGLISYYVEWEGDGERRTWEYLAKLLGERFWEKLLFYEREMGRGTIKHIVKVKAAKKTLPSSAESSIVQSTEPESLTLICDKCSKTFASKSNLVRHRKEIHGENMEEPRSFYCAMCERGFKRLEHLQVHDQTVHRHLKSFSCDCGAVYSTRSNLVKHRKRGRCSSGLVEGHLESLKPKQQHLKVEDEDA